MAKGATIAESKPGLVDRVKTFYQEVRAELDKVSWPSADDLKVSTKVTLFLILALAVVVFAFDKVFAVLVASLLRFA
ncbi:MAG: preprotein translocase subunit SecE [Candidatus Hydrogenedentes bacterium]|nr:preprotein translocase subunit SecE [Candidatus Hydrogenedentota bacterium]